MEAAVGIETDGRRKEIADKIIALAERSELFCLWSMMEAVDVSFFIELFDENLDNMDERGRT